MYWFRGSPLDFLPWLVVSALWLVGGWLLATHVFDLEKRERLVIGVGLGLIPYIWITNILGHWLAPQASFVLSGVVVLALGIIAAWRGKKPYLDWSDLKAWQILLVGLLLVWVFSRIGKGLSLFDEHKNLSLISSMAAGDIPPHYFMNSNIYYAYHYAFQLVGASLMRLGGLTPWSAFDFSKALLGALSILLGYLLGRRYTKSVLGGIVLAVVLLFATGTRYLLLLLPPALLQSADGLVALQGTSAELGVPFSRALLEPWVIDGGPPFPFAFAYLNGILSWPPIMSMQAGPGSLSQAIFILTWLVYDRARNRVFTTILLTMLLSTWALTWETSYGLFLLGVFFITLYQFWKQREIRNLLTPVMLATLISIPIAILQGGTLTGVFGQLLWGPSSTGAVEATFTSTSLGGFFLRWPPAIVSSHLGSLSIFSPLELVVGLFEIGPIILFTPWITIWAWRRFRGGDWFLGAVIITSWIGFITPIFLGYKADRDVSRLSAYGITIWTMLIILFAWDMADRLSDVMKIIVGAGVALLLFGGFVITGSALTATSRGVLPFQFIAQDAYISAEWWDALPEDSEVFDPATWRSTALLGRLNRSSYTANVFALSPEWKELREAPTVEKLLEDGYDYIYLDENWWEDFPEESKASLTRSCVQVLAEHWDNDHEKFRRLLDLTRCK